MRYIAFIILFVFSSSFVQGQKVDWNAAEGTQNISDKIYLLEDKNHNITFEDIQSKEFRDKFYHSGQVILNFGFTTSSYWMHFSLDNKTDENLILELAHTHLENLEFYALGEDGTQHLVKSGYSIPLDEKPTKHHFQIFPIYKGNYQYFIKTSAPVQPLPVRIHNASAYEITTYHQRLVFGFYLGLMFFVILSNLFFYVSLKNKLFLYYSGIVLVYICYASMVMDGFIVYFIPNFDLHFWYLNIPTIGVPVQMMYALVFLEMSKYSPKLHKATTWLIYYFIAYAILKFWMPLTTVLALNTVHALISFFSMFYIGYKAGKKGNRLGYYFATAYLLYFILVLIEATYVQIGKPGYFAELSFVAWATLIEAFFLSFLLSKKFEWEREEAENQKNEAQQLLLEKTRENERIVTEQNVTLEKSVSERTEALKKSLENLKQTQAKLIQSEKLASLGELTAGIAHEIKNPLNFVNNFSEVSAELVDEMSEALKKGDMEEAQEISNDLKINLSKITEHGKRADSIVKGMLQHSRGGSLLKETTDINVLCDEYLRLAYHGFRAKDKSFNASFETNFDPNLPHIKAVTQDLGRVFLNLINNAFYTINEKSKLGIDHFKPMLQIATSVENNMVLIKVQDNGMGVSASVMDKIFQPFYTTKPTGQGTGLGLSLAFDIVKSHGGELDLISKEGEGTTFTIRLPIN
ncbi:MAG: 7TM diverse intracellular signaling domain-containing protein [Saprospiraceae bacterium]